MPAPSRQLPSSEFNSLRSAAADHGETNDCAVKAIAVVTGADYSKVWEIMDRRGRAARKGTPMNIIWGALDELGFQHTWVPTNNIIARYPKPHRDVLKSITTHHPDRFAKAWPAGAYLMLTANHILAIVDGVNHDWTRGRAKRCQGLYIITPKSDAGSPVAALGTHVIARAGENGVTVYYAGRVLSTNGNRWTSNVEDAIKLSDDTDGAAVLSREFILSCVCDREPGIAAWIQRV